MKKKIMLITGTSKGIGKQLAKWYTDKGLHVIGCSRSHINFKLENYCHYCLDVSSEKEAKKIFIQIKKDYGRLDILINNAGIASMNHILLTPINTVKNILNTNFIGTFIFCREASKLMQKAHFGRIINFSTVAVPLKIKGEAVYVASKAAVVSITQILAKELAEFNITVNAIGPTPVKTDLIKAVPQKKLDNLIHQQAIHRFGKIQDITNVIDFFIKPESNFITGQVIYLGGIS